MSRAVLIINVAVWWIILHAITSSHLAVYIDQLKYLIELGDVSIQLERSRDLPVGQNQ